MTPEEVAERYAQAMRDAVIALAQIPTDVDLFARYTLILQAELLKCAKETGTLPEASSAIQSLAEWAAQGAQKGYERFQAIQDRVADFGKPAD